MDIEYQSGLPPILLDEPEFVEGSSVCLFYFIFIFYLVLTFIFKKSMPPIYAFESAEPPEDDDLHSDRPLALRRATRTR